VKRRLKSEGEEYCKGDGEAKEAVRRLKERAGRTGLWVAFIAPDYVILNLFIA